MTAICGSTLAILSPVSFGETVPASVWSGSVVLECVPFAEGVTTTLFKSSINIGDPGLVDMSCTDTTFVDFTPTPLFNVLTTCSGAPLGLICPFASGFPNNVSGDLTREGSKCFLD